MDQTQYLKALKKNLEYQRTLGLQALPKGESRPPAPSHPCTHKAEALQKIRDEMGDCRRCKLYAGRTNLVFGDGNPDAQLMFVGEGPGRDEDAQGRPFVGRAGQLLDKIIEAMGLKRTEVYIANIVKSRPPNNRAPEPDEVAACIPFLHKQIAVIEPKVIVCLGSIATQNLLQTEEKISGLRGNFREWHGIAVMPTYHPAFLLRNPDMKRPVWEDMKKVMEVLKNCLK